MKTEETFAIYKLKMQQHLSELESKIQDLKVKAESATDGKKQQYQALVSDLEGKRNQLQSRLTELGENSSDAFDEVKAGLENAWIELSAAVDKAKASF